jgi:ABC-type Fe3+/spermidine/putrescine transport system ATPase subunit
VAKDEISRRVTEELQRVGLAAEANRKPAQLSGGQQQRVALARAIVFEPRLLLMDEPLGALDKRLRELMQVEIRQLQQKLGITTVSVTHDQVEALVMSDLVAVLDGGRLQQLGPPLEVYQRPANRFVADFLGESNLLSGSRRSDAAGQVSFVSAKGLGSAIAAAPAHPEGDPAYVVIRPEHIAIGSDADSLPNRYSAEISDVLYVGDLVKYRVVAGSGDELVVKSLASSALSWRPGQRVTVGWRSEHCLAVAP